MRYMIIKMLLIGLVLSTGKALALGQETDIRCEVSGLDLNLSGNKVLIEFGSFLLSEKGEKGAIIKYYKLPRTKLVLNVLVLPPKDEMSDDPLDNKLMMSMILGKVPFSSKLEYDKFFDEITKYAVSITQAWYPMGIKKKEESMLSTSFLEKKEPVHIMMKCKKVGS